jgi:hypothetical protein
MRAIVFVAALAVVMPAPAQPAAPEPQVQAPLRDPWVPLHSRRPSSAPPTEGAALKAQIEAKLRASFDAADTKRSGLLTREQARAAGLGIVADNFDRIDTKHGGKVSFDDLKRYLRAQGADL